MKSTRFGFLAFAVAVLAIASTAVTFTVDRVSTARTYAFQVATDFLTSAVAKFEQLALRLMARPVELLQACAYDLRLAKRERPRVTPGWRMCPST
ncbi:hypothetical protein ABL850_15625 [Variovorax paradoxus]|jgi:hypothetical protein|uniref:hypothetical protein n=1 Tax=Variovorax paradoxus TaxID=34073 RepID=UPI0003F7C2F6